MCIFCDKVFRYLEARAEYFVLEDRFTDQAEILWEVIKALEREIGFLFVREFALNRSVSDRAAYLWDHN